MNTEQFDRITLNPAVMGGKPCIRGMRVTVGMIVGQIGAHDHAKERDFVVLTNDLDFGHILAFTHYEKPSVIQMLPLG